MFWSNSGKVQICTKCISLHEISHLGPFTSIHTVTHENSQNTWAHSLGMDFQFTCLCPAIQIGKYVFSRRHTSLLIRQSIWWESLTFSNVTLNGLVWFDVLFFDLPQFIWWIVWARLTSSNVTAIFPNLTPIPPWCHKQRSHLHHFASVTHSQFQQSYQSYQWKCESWLDLGSSENCETFKAFKAFKRSSSSKNKTDHQSLRQGCMHLTNIFAISSVVHKIYICYICPDVLSCSQIED